MISGSVARNLDAFERNLTDTVPLSWVKASTDMAPLSNSFAQIGHSHDGTVIHIFEDVIANSFEEPST
jgi:hypothetical protein